MNLRLTKSKRFAMVIFLGALLTLSSRLYAQVAAFTESTPTAASSIHVCDGDAALTVSFRVLQQVTGTMTVTVKLAEGIEYAGGLTLISTSPGTALKVVEGSASNPNQPSFTVSSANGNNIIEVNDNISFSFKRKATCAAYRKALTANTTGYQFKDEVTISAGTLQSAVASCNAYNIYSPSLLISKPDAQNNREIGNVITRDFTVTNASSNPAKVAYLSIDYGNAIYFSGAGALKLEARLGNSGAYTPLEQFTTTGTVRTYTLSGALLGTDQQLTDGEVIQLRETFTLKTCELSTTYKIGWGCSATDLCDFTTTTATITMATGAANISGYTVTGPVYEAANFEPCKPFDITIKFTNTGNGGAMGAAYNLNLIGRNNFYNPGPFFIHQITGVKINGRNVINSIADGSELNLKFDGQFNTDPDGVGGLEDVDRDGFYDDLPVGATITITLTVKLKCDQFSTCNNAPNDLKDRGLILKTLYQKACDIGSTSWFDPNAWYYTGVTHMTLARESVKDASHLPAVIDKNAPFDLKVATLAYSLTTTYNRYNTNPNSRYVVEIVFPQGTAIPSNSNIKWSRINTSQVDGSLTYETPINLPDQNIIRTGNTVKIISPDPVLGMAILNDIKYDCTNNRQMAISYSIKEVFNYLNYPQCICPVGAIMCNTVTRNVLGCDPACPIGAQTSVPTIERADNSLGWKDYTMTAKQTRDKISKYDLSKAIYMDEIEIKATSTQHGNASSLGARLILATGADNQKSALLTPISTDVTIIRGGATIKTVNGLTGNNIVRSIRQNSNNEQVIDWDFTSVLPTGGLRDKDEVRVVTRYRVTSEFGYRVDTQVGREWFFYNSPSNVSPIWNATDPVSCLKLTPEMYIMGTYTLNGTNPHTISGCTAVDIGGNTYNYARRFAPGALNYMSEYRPGVKIKNIYLKIPKAYKLNRVQYSNYKNHTPALTSAAVWENINYISVTSQGEYNIYKYAFSDNDPKSHFDITVENVYGAGLRANISASCASSATVNAYDQMSCYVDYTDYYYYAKTQTTVPSELNMVANLDFDNNGVWASVGLNLYNRRIQYSDKPSITLVNQSGEVELVGKTGEWKLRINNPSQSAAPYVWLALPTTAGLTITGVTTAVGGVTLTPVPYSGGNMYRVSAEGVGAGKAIDLNIKFSYSGCSPITLKAMGGWNCSDFPATPNEYVCEAQTVDLKLKPLGAAMELTEISVPSAAAATTLCNTLDYTYSVGSTDNANVYKPTFSIFPENGLVVTPNVIQVEYPYGSNNWETINVVGNTANLMSHTKLATVGYLKGVSAAGSNNNERRIKVKFSIKTECEFISGKNFRVRANGLNACDLNAKGSGITVNTPPINIDGATVPYNTTATTQITTVTMNNSDCKAPKTVKVLQKIVGNGVTSANAYLEVFIPAGFKYVPGSYSPDNANSAALNPAVAGSNAAANITSVTTTADGEEKITIATKAGLGNNSEFAYKFAIAEDPANVPTCKNYTLVIDNIEQLAGLMCGTVQCTATKVVTGSNKHTFAYDKSVLKITSSSATGTYNNGAENYTITYTVSNSSAIELKSGTTVTLFADKDNNGIFTTGDAVVGTQVITRDITSTTPLTLTMTVNGVVPANACNLVLSIRPEDGCFCSITPANITIEALDGLAGPDKSACGNTAPTSLTIGTAANSGYIYTWSSTDPIAISYLSSTTVAQPTFTYPNAITSTLRFTYKLTVVRPGGCIATDNVIVTLERCKNYWHGGTSGNANSWDVAGNWTQNYIPGVGEDVEFATADNNYGNPASDDLHVPANTPKVIGNLINNSTKDLVVIPQSRLTINGTVTDTNNNGGTIVVKSANNATNQPTGTLFFGNPANNQNVAAKIEFYNQGYKCQTCGYYTNSWQYFGIPVMQSTFPYGNVDGNETINRWDEFANGNKWVLVPDGSNLFAFQGYEITNDVTSQPSALYTFNGTLVTSNRTINFGTGITGANRTLSMTTGANFTGMNLIGNSYTGAIDIGNGLTFSNAGINKEVYLFNAGTTDQWRKLGTGATQASLSAGSYMVVPQNLAGNTGVLPGIIPSMHAFYVKVTGNNAALTIDYSKLQTNALVNGKAWRSQEETSTIPYLVMDVTGSESADRLWLFEQAGTTQGYDNGWDGEKRMETRVAQMYAQGAQGESFQVSTNATLSGTQIGFTAERDDRYTIEFAASPSIAAQNLYLYDKQTRVSTAIRQGESYTFDAKSGNNGTRFAILRSSDVPSATASNSAIQIFGKRGSGIVVDNGTGEECMVQVYDLSGRLIMKQTVKGGISTTLTGSSSLPQGVYVVNAQNSTVKEVKRVNVE